MQRLLKSFSDAIRGLIYCFKTQKNIYIHLAAAVLVMAAAFWLPVPRMELLFLVVVIFVVLICEVINTSIEKAVDLATTEVTPLAQLAKDIAAGAVLLSAILAVIVGAVIFFRAVF